MIFLLLRRLSPRARVITGLVLAIAGLAVTALSAVVAGLIVHGIVLTVIGVVLWAGGVSAGRRARRQPATDAPPAGEGRA